MDNVKARAYAAIDKAQLAELYWPHRAVRASGQRVDYARRVFKHGATSIRCSIGHSIGDALNNPQPDTAAL